MRRPLLLSIAFLSMLILLAIRFSEHIAYLKWKFNQHVYRVRFEREMRKQLGIVPFSKRIKGSYLAPTNACDDETTRVPDEYTVFLRQGYTLEEHQRNVGSVDWDGALGRVFTDSETQSPYYRITTNETGLAALRADVWVDLVECNIKILPIDVFAGEIDHGPVEGYEWDDEQGSMWAGSE